jgi:hypothetical protein
MEKDPSALVDVPPGLPFTEIDTPVKPTLSLVETTLPVIVLSCADKNVPKSNRGIIISKQLGLGISRGFIL